MNSNLIQSEVGARVVRAIRSVVGMDQVPLHEPKFNGNEWNYIKDCLDTGWVSSVGKYVDRFENDLQAFTGAKYSVAVVNGTAALHVALRLIDVQPGDEVLIPSLTFVATANAVTYCGALPHFVDCEEATLGIDPRALREHLRANTEIRSGQCINRNNGRVIKAIVPMHTFGHPVDIDGVLSVARDFRLTVIEDAAESLGSYYYGRHVGTYGLIGTLSFNGNKTITTGGGAILTNNAELARLAKHITTTAKLPHRWDYVHDKIAYNYRMPNMNAALGCAQLEQLDGFLIAKRRLFDLYTKAFKGFNSVSIFAEPIGCKSNYWLQTLLLSESLAEQRNTILAATNDAGLMTRPVWRLMHKLEPYSNCSKMKLTISESLEQRLINLPSSVNLFNE